MRFGCTDTRRVSPRLPAMAVALLLFAGTQSAGAQSADAQDHTGGSSMTVGGGWLSRPLYPGSAGHDNGFAPAVNLRVGRAFLGLVPGSSSPVGVGVDLYGGDGLRIGTAITTDLGKLRRAGDAARIQGLGDIDGAQRLALYASYAFGRYALAFNAARDVSGHDLGTLVSLGISARFALSDAASVSIGPGLVWGSRRYQRTVFGVTDAQSAASGLAAFDARAGVNLARVVATLTYRLDSHWGLLGRVSLGRLQGDAADSPISEQRTQSSAGLFATYRF